MPRVVTFEKSQVEKQPFDNCFIISAYSTILEDFINPIWEPLGLPGLTLKRVRALNEMMFVETLCLQF